MRCVALLILGVHLAYAARHSLQYFYTGVSGDINFPEFTSVGLVDSGQFYYFDSNQMKAVPKTEWIRENEGADYWNRETENMINAHQVFKNNIQVAKERFNQSSGVHTFQFMYGCELEDDGTTRGDLQYSYDGDDFISFKKDTLDWTAANPQAVITKKKWDADRADSEYQKTYLEKECIEWLKKYVSYGKNTLERKVEPEVSLLQKDKSPVICHATGFYPSNIMMTWKKNNQDHNEDVDVSSTLPNADGTFQKSISLSVKSEEWKKNPDVYRCVIQHVAAEKEIVVPLNENNIRSNTGAVNIIAIVVGCVVMLAVLAAIIGLVVWKKSKGYKRTGTQDSDSENSDQPLPKA
ncbi:major histocompatibility complex class I-related gene protein [Triplophysa dalaica]|uniref:major histocompatibility complex class I-related gene protein n=1 Tax=Triplophysa dalaica TaxID=1582913 RepID=UPI0024DFF5E4|nr:major histocompatibility complex class I-related gene protein [Triplophysa dalaica]